MSYILPTSPEQANCGAITSQVVLIFKDNYEPNKSIENIACCGRGQLCLAGNATIIFYPDYSPKYIAPVCSYCKRD